MFTLHSTTIYMDAHIDNIRDSRTRKFQNILTLRTIISISAAHMKPSNMCIRQSLTFPVCPAPLI